MSSGGGSSTETSTSTTEPAEYLKPYLERSQAEGERLYQEAPLYRPGFNELQGAGLDFITGAAEAPAITPYATGYALQQLGSSPAAEIAGIWGASGMSPEEEMSRIWAMSTPYIEGMVPEIAGSFATAGREGSGLAADAMGEGIGRAVGQSYNQLADRRLATAGLLGDQYEAAQERRGRLAQLSPMLESARYAPGQALFDAGGAVEGQERARLEEPWERFGRYTTLAFGNAPAALAGGTTVGQQPIYRPNPLQQALGIGLTALGAFA